MIKFSGVAAGEACTIVLRGATHQLLDEAERSLHDALAVISQTVRETRTVLGAGCSEMLMSKAVDGAAAKEGGKRQMAVEAYARALRQLPTILADNAGFDSNELVANLRSMHYKGYASYGLGTLFSHSSHSRFDQWCCRRCKRYGNHRELSSKGKFNVLLF